MLHHNLNTDRIVGGEPNGRNDQSQKGETARVVDGREMRHRTKRLGRIDMASFSRSSSYCQMVRIAWGCRRCGLSSAEGDRATHPPEMFSRISDKGRARDDDDALECVDADGLFCSLRMKVAQGGGSRFLALLLIG